MISHVSSPTPSVSSGVRSPALQHPALRGLPAGRGPATAELRGRSLCQGTEMTVNRDGGQWADFKKNLVGGWEHGFYDFP